MHSVEYIYTSDQNDHLFLDLRNFIKWIEEEFEPSLRRGSQAGHYARHPDESGIELYGVCDFACILYSLNKLQITPQKHKEWTTAIDTFQTEKHGWFSEINSTHSSIHNTAFALSSLELLGIEPVKPVSIPSEFNDPKAYLQTLDWKTNVYADSHFGAGIGSICALTNSLRDPKWFSDYFAACDALFCADNGLMGIDKPEDGDTDQIGGTFHYAFLYDHFNRHMPYPEVRINTILDLQNEKGYWDENNQLWLTLDALYMLIRATRQTNYRYEDIKDAAKKVAQHLHQSVFSEEGRTKTFSGKLPVHSLTAAITAAAELQSFLGVEIIHTTLPLRNILDRRPFI